MAVWFTSDTHFGDPRILRIDKRPYRDLAAHDAALIAAWTAVVARDDEVWHLGDFALGPPEARVAEILAALETRRQAGQDEEFDEALRQVSRIARFRLETILGDEQDQR